MTRPEPPPPTSGLGSPGSSRVGGAVQSPASRRKQARPPAVAPPLRRRQQAGRPVARYVVHQLRVQVRLLLAGLLVPLHEGDERLDRCGEQAAQLVGHERGDRGQQRRALGAAAVVALLLLLHLPPEDLEHGGEPLLLERLHDLLAVRVLQVLEGVELHRRSGRQRRHVAQQQVRVQPPQVEHLQHAVVIDGERAVNPFEAAQHVLVPRPERHRVVAQRRGARGN